MNYSQKNVLILVTDYPSENGKEAHRFVHVRNLYYQEHGINISVLSFAAKQSYIYEGIRVITLADYKKEKKQYDLLITHQANIRKHYFFLKKYEKRFPQIIFFFHGHEVLRFSQVYPKPYHYASGSKIAVALRDVYDRFKLSVWKNYIPKVIDKSTLVFVSHWMLDEFIKATGLTLSSLKERYKITYNCVGRLFEECNFDWEAPKQYDFVTIRGNLDGAKYCIDVVNELAKTNPNSKFLVVGRGEFFSHYEKADNITWMNTTMNHTQIIETMQMARCALMPTRTDSQGLMMCEMATFGMPVITSDIPVCYEALSGFDNVEMIDHNRYDYDLNAICCDLEKRLPYPKNNKYFMKNTCAHEIDIINSILDSICEH